MEIQLFRSCYSYHSKWHSNQTDTIFLCALLYSKYGYILMCLSHLHFKGRSIYTCVHKLITFISKLHLMEVWPSHNDLKQEGYIEPLNNTWQTGTWAFPATFMHYRRRKSSLSHEGNQHHTSLNGMQTIGEVKVPYKHWSHQRGQVCNRPDFTETEDVNLPNGLPRNQQRTLKAPRLARTGSRSPLHSSAMPLHYKQEKNKQNKININRYWIQL